MYLIIILFIIFGNDDDDDDDEAKAVLPKLVLLLFDCIQSYCNSNPIMLKFITIFLFLIVVFPIITTIIAYISDLSRRRRCRSTASSINSTLPLLPFLPDSEHVSKEEYDSVCKALTTNTMKMKQQQQQQQQQQEEETDKDNNNWAIITGASKGIGRAIGISLARRGNNANINGIILVARNKEKLNLLSNEIKNCYYGIQTLVVQCDITIDEDISDMIKMIKSKNLTINILIANAGVGDRADFLNMTPTKMELILNTNIIGTTKFIHQVATQLMINVNNKNTKKKSKQCDDDDDVQKQQQHQQKRKRKRMIVLMSSITGSVPGVPSSAVYAASKAYQRSFCSSFSRELESLDDNDDDDGSAIQVQCIMPGAVKETNFSNIANMNNTPFFYQQSKNDAGTKSNNIDIATKIGLTLTPEYVAECTVEEMFSGKAKQEVYVGWIYVFIGRIAGDLLPRRLQLLACELTFSDTILPSILSYFRSSSSESLSESESLESEHKKEE